MLLKRLTEAMGPSGFEDEVRGILREEVSPYVDAIYTDVLGTLICEKGRSQPGPCVMLDAHMDEVGLMVVGVENSGLLRFRPLGGVDPRILVAKRVRVGSSKLPGVIGSKPIHLQKPDEQKHPIPEDELFIDIGAKDKEDALANVQLGDVAVFDTLFDTIGDGCVKAKSFDDRVGCYILSEILKKFYAVPLVGAFTVQEEVGLRGATAAAHRIAPDIAIALEATVCFDGPFVPSHSEGTRLHGGPALTVQDGRTVADVRFLRFMMETATKHNIPYQLRRVKGGSNDFAAIQKSREGVVGGAISIPLRYMHAPAQIVSSKDVENAIRLVDAILQEIASGNWVEERFAN